MEPRCAVVNVAQGAWYPRGQRRLVESLDAVGFPSWGQIHTFTDPTQVGAEPHSVAPYAFKPRALLNVGLLGVDLVLWCDASVWAVRPLERVFHQIRTEGHLFWHNCLTGPWASDKALIYFGVTRDQAMTIPMLHGLCMGLDLRRPRAQEFLWRWQAAIPTFPGAWTNEAQQVSKDPRVTGHRHDQTAASLIAWQLGMGLTPTNPLLWHPTAPIHQDQVDPFAPINSCLYAQGM